MDSTPPIACTLTPAELPERAAEIRALGRDGLLSAQRGGREVILRFRPGRDILARVEAFVAAESRCCPFLDFEIDEQADATTLTIATPEGGEPILGQLAAGFGGSG